MSATKDPARRATERGGEEVVAALRKHLSDEDAEMLAGRIDKSEQDEEHSTPWSAVKRRILQGTPKP